MGFVFEIDVEEGIIYSIAEGTIGLEDIQANGEKLVADPRYHPDLSHIIEFRLSRLSLSEEEVKVLASTHTLGVNPRKLAMVADGPQRKALLQYKEWIAEEILVEVFTDFGSAKEWLRPPSEDDS